MKRKIKLIIDILLGIIFIILMGYHITGNQIHEIIGAVSFVLFIIHNILNFNYFKTIFKGKYNFNRVLRLVINFLLLVAMIGTMVSAIIISSTVFDFLNIKTTWFARNMHVVSTSWVYILMSLHIGLHLEILIKKINQKMKNHILEYVYYLFVFLICVYGVYSFVKTKIISDMFLLSPFKFVDESLNVFIYYLRYISLIFLGTAIIYIILNIYRKKR